jgi:hypothetical protein
MKNQDSSMEIIVRKDGTVSVEMSDMSQVNKLTKILSATNVGEQVKKIKSDVASLPESVEKIDRRKKAYRTLSKGKKKQNTRGKEWSELEYETIINNMDVPASAIVKFPAMKERSIGSIATKKSAIRYGLVTQMNPRIVVEVLKKLGKMSEVEALLAKMESFQPFKSHEIEG